MGKCLFMRKGETHTVPVSRLPQGYTSLEYIESSGTQYINTGVIPNENTRIVLDVQLLSPQTGRHFLFGSRESGVAHFWVEKNAGDIFVTNYATQGDKSFPTVNAYNRVIIDKNSNVTTIGSETVTHTAGALNSSLPMFLFVENYNGTASTFTAMKLYSCQIYDNGTIVRDFIPCISDTDGVGLYDCVNKTFYGNAGTGTFIGSEVA